jgi:hypothetical protein
MVFLLITLGWDLAFSQVELAPWGNITGIRIDGELMKFESDLSLVQRNGYLIHATAKERQRPTYIRKGRDQIVNTNIDSLYIREVVHDEGDGSATIDIKLAAKANISAEGVFFGLLLPGQYYAGGDFIINRLKPQGIVRKSSKFPDYLPVPADSLRFISPLRQLTVVLEEPARVIIEKAGSRPTGDIRIYMALQQGDLKKGDTLEKKISIRTWGTLDRAPMTIAVNTSRTGRRFDGFGGNFRLQNPKADPQVIDYCLKNMRVAWGRVEMPWSAWQPAMDTDPVLEARAGRLDPHVKKSMEMAQRLYKAGMPVILTAWFPPQWAVEGPLKFGPSPDGIWGNALDTSKMRKIYKSLAGYIGYLKEAYCVEIADFSFNESDLGINIRQTGEEQDALIKGLGAYFVSMGLKTKLLLGDNSDATTYAFIKPAANDSAARPYMGAISFHSWRGWDKRTLQKWADAATRLDLPLIVAEGSIDAQAWGYPAIFQEPVYALQEINLYIRLLAICQPLTILQWQLTSDYSPLAGGGIFGDDGPLRPTQRFWNLKQLASTPEGLYAMKADTRADDITVAAMGDPSTGRYAIHLVNNGTTRKVTLTGLPSSLRKLQVWITDKTHGMQELTSVPVVKGRAAFMADAGSFITLINP